MSSTTGWETKQNIENLPFNNAGWCSSTASNLSSPLSHPGSWPQLGAGQENVPKLEVRQQQPNQTYTDNMQRPEVSGWGAPAPSDSSVTSPNSGWGMSQGTGWGSANGGGNNWSRQPQIDNGTSLWGKQNQGGSGWGAPSSQPPRPPAPSSWNTAPPLPTSSGTSAQNSGTPHQEEQNTQAMPPQSPSNPPPQQPESWAAAAAAPPQGKPGHSQPPPSATSVQQSSAKDAETIQENPPQEQERSEGAEAAPGIDANDEVQKLVNSHEGWGKTPIEQNRSWVVEDSPGFTELATNKTGTEAWGKTPLGKPASGWQGTPTMPDPNTQQWGKTPVNPVRGWGHGSSQAPPPPRPPWAGAQPNQPPPPPQTGWNDPRLPSPTPAMNANRWNTPGNTMPNSANQGWGTPNIQPTGGWNTSAGSNDNAGWGANVQRNTQTSNWGAPPPPRPEGNWNQPQNMQRQSSMADDGTSAWGDPTTYKNVAMWDKSSVGGNIGAGDAPQSKSETLGWGAPAPPQNNKPSPTGWGDVGSNKPGVDDGSSAWGKKAQASNWDQNPGWGIGKSDKSNGWSNADQSGPQWGQPDNDAARVKGKDFGFPDRKTSTGSDHLFADGQNVNGMGGDIRTGPSGVNYGQFSGVSSNNSGMPGLNGPRPHPLQNPMGVQAPYRQGPPMPPQLQSQIQQIRLAVMKGVIPREILTPQFMSNPQHLNLLQLLMMKMTEYQQLSARMTLLSKPNLPPQLRSQQEQIARMLRQCQQQIQAHQRALTQNLVPQKSPSLHDKGNMGVMGPNSGMGLDLPLSSGAMPPANSSISPFNMSTMSQNLPSASGNPLNREQQSRLHSWRRPSTGFDNSSENSAGNPLSPGMPHPSISDMIGSSGLLSSTGEQGGLLGLHQPDARGLTGEQIPEMNGILTGESPMNPAEPDVVSNLKNILADIGPPEFIPGKKWAGFRTIDPESDPDITPGSVAIAKTMSVNTVKDVDQVLNRDRYTVSQVDNTVQNFVDIAAKSQPSLASSFANITNDNQNAMSSSSGWSTGSGWADNKSWLVLTNLSPQLELNTLRNLCSMNGKMASFQPNTPVRGMALVKYLSAEDAMMARQKLGMSFAGTGLLTANVASDQEVGAFLNTSSGNNWNPGSSGRRLFGSSGTLLGNPPQGPPSFGSGHNMMPNSDMGYPSETQNMWSTGDNSRAMHNPHSSMSWSTGANQAPGRPMGMNMWNNAGLYDNPRVASPLHSLLPENLLGEHPL